LFVTSSYVFFELHVLIYPLLPEFLSVFKVVENKAFGAKMLSFNYDFACMGFAMTFSTEDNAIRFCIASALCRWLDTMNVKDIVVVIPADLALAFNPF